MKGTPLGVPTMRMLVFWGLYWGPPILGSDQVSNKSRVLGFKV